MPSWRATLSGGCIRSVRAFSNALSSTFWCAWAMAADGSRWAGRSAGGATAGWAASSRGTNSGLDVVYVQAKRLDPNKAVPLSEVRDFVGGLEGHRASKGVLVTTSYFPSTAYDFITRVSKRVVLIDGQALANLMIRHRVGIRVKDIYEVRKIDESYFVE